MKPLQLRSYIAVAAALLPLSCAPKAVTGVGQEVNVAEAPPTTERSQTPSPTTSTPTPLTPTQPMTPTPGFARGITDLHVDTISRVLLEGLDIDNDPALESSLDQMDAANVGIIVEAVWVPASNKAPDPHAWAVANVTTLSRAIVDRPDRWTLIKDAADISALRGTDQLGAVIAIEGGHALRSAADVTLFYDLGVRMIGLTWSFSNPLCGSSGDQPRPGSGVTPLGEAVVSEMNRLGIAIDLSHASDACIDDVLSLSEAPVLASHSNARAIRDVPRNLSDAHLMEIAEMGGVVGVMFHGPFVGPDPDRQDVVEHILYMGRLMGFEHVSLGTDFDGWIAKPSGLSTTEDLPSLAQSLSDAGLSDQEIAGVMGANARRYLMTVMSEAFAPPVN